MLLLAAPAFGCRRDPDAAAWRALAALPPAPPLPLEPAWDVEAPFCPQEIVPAPPGRVALRAAGDAALLQTADGAPLPGPAPGPASVDSATASAERAVDAAGAFAGRTAIALWDGLALFALPGRGRLVAFDLESSRVHWEFRAAADARAAPQVVRGRVLFQSLDNHLYCLRAKNGHEVWRVRAGARLTRPAAPWRDRVLVIAEGSAEVEAFDLRDGSPAGKWTLPAADVRFVAGPQVADDLLVAAYAGFGASRCRLVALRLAARPPG